MSVTTSRPIMARPPSRLFAQAGQRQIAVNSVKAGEPEIVTKNSHQSSISGESERVEVRGRVGHKIFHSKDSGYTVLAMKFDDIGDSTLRTTTTIEPGIGERIVAWGAWGVYKGKRQFQADAIQLEIPQEAKGIATWLNRGAVKGVGKSTIAKLIAAEGDNIKNVIAYPEKMARTIGLKKAELIAKAWNSNASQPELVALLSGYGLSAKQIARIIETYGASIKKLVKTNPWELTDIEGIGFVTADRIARHEGLDKNCSPRIQAGLGWVLNERLGLQGHCGVPRRELIKGSSRLLDVEPEIIESELDTFIDGIRVIDDADVGLIYPRQLWEAERCVADHIANLISRGEGWVCRMEAESLVERAERELNVELDRDGGQFEAAVMALSKAICVITGGPGTGKSTTQAVIVKAFSFIGKGNDRISLGAPTGRAAKRLSETSGRNAETIHRMLRWSPQIGDFSHDENNPLDQDVIIIDEVSMVELRHSAALVKALRRGATLILVGDYDQLPSVGPGQVLRDLIESKVVPVARLTRIHRQAAGSGIAIATHRINSGLTPMEPENPMRGFRMQICQDVQIIEQIVNLVRFDLPETGFDPMRDVQILASMKDGDVGVHALNDAVKAALNPALDDENTVVLAKRAFTIGDRVMQIRNDYMKGVNNGEVGTVIRAGIDTTNPTTGRTTFIVVDFLGVEARYTSEDIGDLQLAYAATVHKSQGCEFPVVILVAPDSHRMLNRNLLYTGISRAKSECITTGSKRAIENAVKIADGFRRYTGLRQRIRIACGLNADDK